MYLLSLNSSWVDPFLSVQVLIKHPSILWLASLPTGSLHGKSDLFYGPWSQNWPSQELHLYKAMKWELIFLYTLIPVFAFRYDKWLLDQFVAPHIPLCLLPRFLAYAVPTAWDVAPHRLIFSMVKFQLLSFLKLLWLANEMQSLPPTPLLSMYIELLSLIYQFHLCIYVI